MKKIYLLTAILLIISSSIRAQSTTVVSGLDGPAGMALNGNDLYIAEFDGNKIIKIDITDPSPTPVTVVSGLNNPYDIALNGNELFISEYGGGKISKIDITMPSPTAIDVISPVNGPAGIAFNGNDLYIALFDGGSIWRVDVSAAVPIPDPLFATFAPIGIMLDGDELYYTGLSTVSKADISVTPPTFASVIDGLSDPYGLTLIGDELYITEQGLNKISKIDITATTPATTDVVTGLDAPNETLFFGTELFIAEYEGNRISKVDLATLSKPDLEAELDVKIIPNPSSNYLQVIGITESVDYIIYDYLGRQIKKGIVNQYEKLDIQDLSNGLYILNLNNRTAVKFIKE